MDTYPAPSARFKQKKFSIKKEKALSFLQKLFANRATCPKETTSDEELIKVWCLEFVKYVSFFILMVSDIFYPIHIKKRNKVVTTNHFTTNDTVSLNKTVRQHFLDDYDFNDITTIDQTWDYLENGLIKNLYEESIQDTIMISKPRLRIQKVNSKSCPRQENEEVSFCKLFF